MNFNLQAPIFEGAPTPPKIGIPLRLYDQYILKCLASGVSVTEIFSQLQAIGYKQKYSTFAQFVSKKVLQKGTHQAGSNYQKARAVINKPEAKSSYDSEVPSSARINVSDLMIKPVTILDQILEHKKQLRSENR